MLIELMTATQQMSQALDELSFTDPVAYVYNPLDYAWRAHQAYLRRFGARRGRVVLVGMNPGPFGMAQSGVPFGDVPMVRDWMGICEEVGKPATEHPKRLVEGFALARSEVSGTRLWGWAKDRFGTPEAFFERFFVINYCPLLFLHESGRNLTPDKVSRSERDPMLEICNAALTRVLRLLQPARVIGVGVWAERRARDCAGDVPVSRILHPSPASPAANRGWASQAEAQLLAAGVEIQ